MAINLMALEPHKVSRDLSGYITYIYGVAKIGKTTLGSQMPKPLLLAFEKGYNALPGVIAQDIVSWAEMKQVVRELKKPEVKERFSTVVVDTVDIAATLCDKYICNSNNVDTISQIPYGQGWTMLKKEFEDVFRQITLAGYAVCFISHVKEEPFKRQDGTEYTLIRPSVGNTYNKIIENMADLYGYMHPVFDPSTNQTKVVITLRSLDGTISAGGRFKHIPAEIDSSYDALVKALNEAIDKTAAESGSEFVTDEREKIVTETVYDFDALMATFNETLQKIVSNVPEDKFVEWWQPRIIEITDKYLGKGKKVSQCTRAQAEMLSLVVDDFVALANENL